MSERFKLKWLDLEDGSKTLLQLPVEWQKNIDIVRIPDSRLLPIAGSTLLSLTMNGKGTICHAHGAFNCPLPNCKAPVKEGELEKLFPIDLLNFPQDQILVIDSITQLASSFMTRIMKTIWDKDAEEMPEWKHYAHQGNLLNNVMSVIQAGKFHCVCISHEIQAETPDAKNKLVPIAGTRNFSATVAKFFDDVVYCEVKNKAHSFGSSSTYGLNIVSGSRNNIEINKYKNPTLIPFFDKDYKAELKTPPVVPK